MQRHRLRRSRRNRWIVGVCGGFGERYGVPPLLLRLALIVGTIFWLPVSLIYLVAWLLIPEEPEELEPTASYENGEEDAEALGDGSGSTIDSESPSEWQGRESTSTDPWATEDERGSF